MAQAGIYKIINLKNNKFYVGSSVNLNKRKNEHFLSLSRNAHTNKHLQNSWNNQTKKDFIFEVIEICGKQDLLAKEQFYIDNLKPEYNILQVAGNTLGFKHSEETKNILSIKHKGKILSKETKEKMSNSRKGIMNPNYNKIMTEETKQKISKATKGKKRNCGENNPISKLTKETVELIRKKYVKGIYGYIRLSKEFGVSPKTIEEIINKKIWNY
jgi:group I intron endonuclease